MTTPKRSEAGEAGNVSNNSKIHDALPRYQCYQAVQRCRERYPEIVERWNSEELCGGWPQREFDWTGPPRRTALERLAAAACIVGCVAVLVLLVLGIVH